jgi:hypothetical protein
VSGLRSKQTGLALVVGLIMLVVLTLLVLSAIHSGTVNLRIAGNMQSQDEARAVAQQAIEQFASDYRNFCTNLPPGACIPPSPGGKPATGYDINNDGTSDYVVVVSKPVCRRAAAQIPARSTDCASGVRAGLYCWDTLWEVTANASDSRSGVLQTVTGGFAITFDPTVLPSAVGC